MATLNIMTWNIENLGLSKLKKNANIGKQMAGIVAQNNIDVLFSLNLEHSNLITYLPHPYIIFEYVFCVKSPLRRKKGRHYL